MKNCNCSKESMVNEYSEFLCCCLVSPSPELSEKVCRCVSNDLNPKVISVFFKFLGIHAVVGTITLLFCPQFGMKPFCDVGLMSYLMGFGEEVCMFGCGAVYLGFSALLTGLMLKSQELKVLRKTEILQMFVLSSLSVGAFQCFGVNFVFPLVSIWILGSLVGGVIAFETGLKIRKLAMLKTIGGWL